MKRPSQELVDAFFAWYHAVPHGRDEDYYAGQINDSAIRGLTREAFIEFFFQFARDGGKVQSGGHRTAPMFRDTIGRKYESFRNFVLEPFGEGFDELKWLDRTGEFHGFGQGLATIYLNRVDKKRFAIINNKAIEAMSLLDVQIPTALVPRYEAIRNAEQSLMDWFPDFDNFYRTDALSQFLIGEESGRRWADELRGNPASGVRYWVYAPGERARLWEQYLAEGVLGIGWKEIRQDLGQLTESELRKVSDAAYGERTNDTDFRQLCDFVQKMQVGDRVFVKRGIGELVGYGEVSSGYFFDAARPEYRHLRKANWLQNGSWKIPEGDKGLPVKTLTEIRDPERRDALLALIGQDPGSVQGQEQPLFSKKAFELLSELHENPHLTYYEEHAEEFDVAIETPLRRLMGNVAAALPVTMTAAMETQKRIFSRINKNDYGKGGTWDYYWAAFYPKGGKRTADAQLFVFISGRSLRYGFAISDYGVEPKRQFTENCQTYATELKTLLGSHLSGADLQFGDRPDATESTDSSTVARTLTWSEWLGHPDRYGFGAVIELTPEETIKRSERTITEAVIKTFERLFPLVALTQSNAPLDSIRHYVGEAPPLDDERMPPFSLEQVATAANMPLDGLQQWVRAINRKKQAIIYGPPGTGKTYLARLLARHLVGGNDGVFDVLQFHPSYAYEDFMQGLRPKAQKAGGLEYTMEAGRFKEFCEQAAKCHGPCVLVIDEINRANLSRVFGELMYLLEYRTESVPLAAGGTFQIPDNVRIIGTMNTADRSIALVDHALRRRFAFLALYPNYDVLRRFHAAGTYNVEGLIGVLGRLNAAIQDPHYAVGVTYFLDKAIRDTLQDVWQMEIEPYIEELFFDQPKKAESFAWNSVRDEIIGA